MEKTKDIASVSTPNESIIAAQMLMEDLRRDCFKKLGIQFRANYILNSIKKIRVDFPEMKQVDFENMINWEYINKVLFEDKDEYDYNLVSKVKTINDIDCLLSNAMAASCNLGPWQRHKCKDCGKEFYLTRDEVSFFEDKEFQVPHRCKPCRKSRKNNRNRHTEDD
jgi:hypothetical protein